MRLELMLSPAALSATRGIDAIETAGTVPGHVISSTNKKGRTLRPNETFLYPPPCGEGRERVMLSGVGVVVWTPAASRQQQQQQHLPPPRPTSRVALRRADPPRKGEGGTSGLGPSLRQRSATRRTNTPRLLLPCPVAGGYSLPTMGGPKARMAAPPSRCQVAPHGVALGKLRLIGAQRRILRILVDLRHVGRIDGDLWRSRDRLLLHHGERERRRHVRSLPCCTAGSTTGSATSGRVAVG